jgi:hypothetical protein
MAQFTVNPGRFDPYKNFKFRVKWGPPNQYRGMLGSIRSAQAWMPPARLRTF